MKISEYTEILDRMAVKKLPFCDPLIPKEHTIKQREGYTKGALDILMELSKEEKIKIINKLNYGR